MLDFFKRIITVLQDNNIKYMLSGSMALSLYTIPRATRDFDFVVHLSAADISVLDNNFKDGYYCDKASIEDAVKRQSIFNIIDFGSGFKADFIVLKDDIYRQTEFERRRTTTFLDTVVYVVSAEDLLISKLIWIQELQSAKQVEDIEALKKIPDLDWNYIKFWVEKMKIKTFGIF